MKNKPKWILYIWFIVILICILMTNPSLLKKELTPIANSALIWNTAIFQNQSASANEEQMAFYYRQNLQRNSFFNVAKIPKSLELEWTSEKLNVGIHTASKSSVISDGTLLYTGDDSSWFYAYELNGKLKWKFYLGDSPRGIHSSAAIDDKFVYIGSYRGSLYKLKKNSGELVWKRTVGETIGSSPFLDNDFLVVAVETVNPDGYVVKINKHTGDLVWKSNFLGEQSHSSPALSLDKKILTLGANNQQMFGLNYETGKILWTTQLDGFIKSTPIIIENKVYVTTRGGSLICLQVNLGGVLWRAPLGSSQASPIFLQNKKLIVAPSSAGDLIAFNISDGKEEWRIKFDVASQMSSPIVLNDGKNEEILFHCEDGFICQISDKGKVIKKTQSYGRSTSSPFVASDRVFFTFDEGGIQSFKFRN